MSPVLIKGLVAAGGIGLGGVGIWQFTEYMAPKTLQQKLEWEGESFYPFDDDQQLSGWKSLAKAFKANHDSSEQNLKLTGVNITNTGDSITDTESKSLRDACKALADGDPNGDNASGNAAKLRKWCVVSNSTNPGSSQQ